MYSDIFVAYGIGAATQPDSNSETHKTAWTDIIGYEAGKIVHFVKKILQV